MQLLLSRLTGSLSLVSSATSLAMLAALSGTALAQSFNWVQAPAANAPSARSGHAAANDPQNDRVVLFGGQGSTDLNDVWHWIDGQWIEQSTTSVRPDARHGHAIAYDGNTGNMLLFGGASSSGTEYGDTWMWDGAFWIELAPANSPPARQDHAMVWDEARQQLLLVGGESGGAVMGDSWTWDGTNWSQGPLVTSFGIARHAMSYDRARQRVVLFGGDLGGPNPVAATREYDGVSWISLSPIGFSLRRRGHAMAYDEGISRTVVFGGVGAAGEPLQDTITWDGVSWVTVPASLPAPRSEHSLVYAAGSGEMLMFGGDNGGLLPDTWTGGADFRIYGAGCGSPALELLPDAAPPQIGQPLTATINNASSALAAVSLGLRRDFLGPFPLPIPLGAYGMPGCSILHSSEIAGLPTTPLTPSTLSFQILLPNAASFIGQHVYGQAYALAPGQNPTQVVLSNGVDWLVGCPPIAPQQILENFDTGAQLDRTASGGSWLGGFASFAQIGGDARHGDFDVSIAIDTGLVIGGKRVYEIDCGNTLIPAANGTTGSDQLVTDGRFYFASMTIEADQVVRFVGSVPLVLNVAGDLTILGDLDASGASLGAHVAVLPVGQPGARGGPGAGAGGAGGNRCQGVGPGTGEFDGHDGEDASVLAGHAYANTVTGTGGEGSALYPASGLSIDQQFGVGIPSPGLFYCLSAAAGGSGGGLLQPGESGLVTGVFSGTTPLPNQGQFMGPPTAGGSTMQLLPVPPSGTLPNSLHFLAGGSGGGGSASNATLSLNLARSWASGAGGGGGGGAVALRAGRSLEVGVGARLLATGGSAADYIGISASAQVAPAGGGSGGSIVLQAAEFAAMQGFVDVRGGRGGRFSRQGGSGIGPFGGRVEIEGGNGGSGYVRLELPVVPTPAQLGAVEPPASVDNVGALTETDQLSSMRSLTYATGLLCAPVYSHYELQALVDGVATTFSDDPAVSSMQAGVGAPVRAWFQAMSQDPLTGVATPVGPWRETIRTSPGQTGISVDGGNAYRFQLAFDRAFASTLEVDSLVVTYSH